MTNPVSFSCHSVADKRTALSMGLSGSAAVAIAVTFVVLAALEIMPIWAYGIGGGGFVVSFAIGALVATIRRHDEAEVGLKNESEQIVTEPKQTQIACPSLEEALKKAKCISVDRTVGQVQPPSAIWPFPSGYFTFSLSIEGEEKTLGYTAQVAQFFEQDNELWATLILNGELKNFKVDESTGPEWNPDSQGWVMPLSQGRPVDRAYQLNSQMMLKGYLSYIRAWYDLYCHITEGSSAHYFYLKRVGNGITLDIPDLYDRKGLLVGKNVLLTFKRDASIPLINAEQLALLKKSNVDWHKSIVEQLESDEWTYTLERDRFKSWGEVGDNPSMVWITVTEQKPQSF